MKIAYRRMSGAIGLTKSEIGTRGLWLEKRLAFVNLLISRGHHVDYIGRMTKASKKFEKKNKLNHDLLFIEFGSSNTLSYGEDIEETISMASEYKGPIIFLCDDPDLPFLWNKIKYSELYGWYNCLNPSKINHPENVEVFDFPFSAFQNARLPISFYRKDKLVYIGRPNGREKEIKEISKSKIPWIVYGDKKHWTDFEVASCDAPSQSLRSDFYNRSLGSIVLCDKKHVELGWRTGRAFHSALSGCPAISFGEKNEGLSHFPNCQTTEELSEYFNKWKSSSEERNKEVKRQVESIFSEKEKGLNLLKDFDL